MYALRRPNDQRRYPVCKSSMLKIFCTREGASASGFRLVAWRTTRRSANFLKNRHRSSTVFALQVHPAMPTQEQVEGVRRRTAERYVALCLWLIVAVMFF